jgi:hypothetical protein
MNLGHLPLPLLETEQVNSFRESVVYACRIETFGIGNVLSEDTL